MSEDRAAYLGKPPRKHLRAEVLRLAEDAYNQILNGTGRGKITIYIEKGGTSREQQHVSLEFGLASDGQSPSVAPGS